MNGSVAGPEEATQDPTDQTDYDPGKESRPESRDMEAGDHLGDKEDQEGIDHQDEEAHRHDDEGEAQEEQNRPYQSIDDTKEESSPEKGAGSVIRDARNEPGGPQNRESGDKPSEQEFLHISSIWPDMTKLASKNHFTGPTNGIPFAYKE